MKLDVLVIGGGPAGAVAALVLARAGVRVHVVDRARFPRDKLCGDSLNPGALALLRRLGLSGFPESRSVPVDGMLVSGEHGAHVEARYPAGVRGRIVSRFDLDAWLLESAIAAGATFEEAARVMNAEVAPGADRRVEGVRLATVNATRTLSAPMTIAADGRRSTIAFGLGLSRHPVRPRRWALGGYFEGVRGLTSLGEMHIRAGRYIGVAPMCGGLANVCLVTEDRRLLRGLRPRGSERSDGSRVGPLEEVLAADHQLAERFTDARLVGDATMLGPLAVDASDAGLPGLLLAGDAAGFIDPMTGDGMRFAIRGGMLAAEAALGALEGRIELPHRWLAARRRAEFGWKRAFNRTLRSMVSRPWSVRVASSAGEMCPWAVQRLVSLAGDVRRGIAA